MPQDPTGSGTSSFSSSSDLAESDGRNDDDDDDDEEDENDDATAVVENDAVEDHPARIDADYVHDPSIGEDAYETVTSDQRSMEYLGFAREVAYDSRKVIDQRRRYDEYHGCEYTETTLTQPASEIHDCSSSSANSLDDLCRGHRRMLAEYNQAESSSARDHYMVPTRDPRELNERILSLFNPQFLPNFNDMIMYVASQCDARRTPPPRSRSMAEGDDRFFRSSSYRKKRVGAGSMFFRRGLTYEATHK